jgi:ADP-ribose pyrophosphatase YjhB (NUDIX family)
VQNSFYASGFLYSLKTHKILLLQSEQIGTNTNPWSTIGGEGFEGEDASATFQRIVYKLLNLTLKPKNIFSVYDYFHESLKKINYVFYAKVNNAQKFATSKGTSFSWVNFRETSKLIFTPQTKQDIIVGERVISAKWRDDEAKKNPLFV